MALMDHQLVQLDAGVTTIPFRSSSNAICVGVEGHGASTIGNETFAWGPKDVFTMPQGNWITHRAETERARLFVYSDREVYARLGLLLAHDGRLGDRQIIPEEWLHAATTIAPDDWHLKRVWDRTGFGYGYQTWIFPGERRMFALLGVHGQGLAPLNAGDPGRVPVDGRRIRRDRAEGTTHSQRPRSRAQSHELAGELGGVRRRRCDEDQQYEPSDANPHSLPSYGSERGGSVQLHEWVIQGWALE